MAVHTTIINDEKVFYTYYQGHRNAIVLEFDLKYKQWDTLIIQCPVPRWNNLPIYKKISFVEVPEQSGNGNILLHLKS